MHAAEAAAKAAGKAPAAVAAASVSERNYPSVTLIRYWRFSLVIHFYFHFNIQFNLS